jgi:hypothetical protein
VIGATGAVGDQRRSGYATLGPAFGPTLVIGAAGFALSFKERQLLYSLETGT